MTALHETCESQRTFSTGYRGFGRVHFLDEPPDKAGIGIWMSDSIFWAQRYANIYDGMNGWENCDSYLVTCIFDKHCIDSMEDITDKIPEVWWGVGEEGRTACQSV